MVNGNVRENGTLIRDFTHPESDFVICTFQ